MRLIETLQQCLAGEPSPFQAQLLREDIVRLTRLSELARSTTDMHAFSVASMRIGWTEGDSRTHELAVPLARLLDAIYAYCSGRTDAAQEARICDAWDELHRVRMERLVGCLSNPVPGPDE